MSVVAIIVGNVALFPNHLNSGIDYVCARGFIFIFVAFAAAVAAVAVASATTAASSAAILHCFFLQPL